MAKCGYCGSTIIMGGVTSGRERFCNDKCHQNAYVLAVSQHVPENVVNQQVDLVFRGNCPRCGQLGPVDIHQVHRVWSALVLTNWSSASLLSCRSCAIKSQIGGILFSGTLGWWGIPWGFILTPVQIVRNFVGMFSGPNPASPSAELRKLVRVNLGVQLYNKGRARSRRHCRDARDRAAECIWRTILSNRLCWTN